MTRRGVTLLVTGLLAVLLVLVGALLPVPYVALSPGPITDTLGEVDGTPLITVDGRETFETTGELNLTTVGVSSRIELSQAVRGWFSDSIAVVPREQIFPPGETEQQVDAENAAAFSSSQRNATAAALTELGVPYTSQVVVSQVNDGSPAQGQLQVGDVLVSVDGAPVEGAESVGAAVRDRRAGDPVTIGYRRDGGEPVEVELATVEAPDGRPVIGVLPGLGDLDFGFTIDISLDEVGGPSAGLMFALGIVDKLTAEDLAAGSVIAGTGSIDAAGAVSPIGGIRQKLVAADEIDARAFLVPEANCAEAMTDPPDGLLLVSVTSLDQAVESLRTLADGGQPQLCGG